MNKRKHHDEIVAWAEGANIQWLGNNGIWNDVETPSFDDTRQYRVRPEVKLDHVVYFNIGRYGANKIEFWQQELIKPNIMATFDAETWELKSVEVLK